MIEFTVIDAEIARGARAADTCLGYDLTGAVFNDIDVDAVMRGNSMPEVVLVRKTFPMWRKRNRSRTWKLKRMPQVESARPNAIKHNETKADYESFLQELEEDKEMRKKINLYKDDTPRKIDLDAEGEEVEDDFPEVDLDELLDELTITPLYVVGDDSAKPVDTEPPLPSASIHVPTPQYGAEPEEPTNSTSA